MVIKFELIWLIKNMGDNNEKEYSSFCANDLSSDTWFFRNKT